MLLQAGKWPTMTNNSFLMFHGPVEDATQAELQLAEQLAEMVAKRVGMGVTEGCGLFSNTFIKPDRPLELGLIDEIRQPQPPVCACR